MKIQTLLLSSALMWGASLSQAACPQLSDSNLSIALYPVQDRIGLNRELAQGLPDIISTGLVRLGQAKVLERSQLRTGGEAVKFESDNLTVEERKRMAKWTGASTFLLSSLTPLGNQVRIDLRLVEANSGEVLCATSSTGETHKIIQNLELALQNWSKESKTSPVPTESAPEIVLAPKPTFNFVYTLKIANSILNERAIPVQKVRLMVNGQLWAESKAITKINEDVVMINTSLPSGNAKLEVVHGMVDRKGNWYTTLTEQPKIDIASHAQPNATLAYRCLQIVSDQAIQYRCN
jgi:TolB-like protein